MAKAKSKSSGRLKQPPKGANTKRKPNSAYAANRATILQRKQEAEEIILGMRENGQSVQECAERWGIGIRQAHKYFAAVRKDIKKRYDKKNETYREELVEQLRHAVEIILPKLKESPNLLSPFVGAVREMGKLTGVYPDPRIDLNLDIKASLQDITDEINSAHAQDGWTEKD